MKSEIGKREVKGNTLKWQVAEKAKKGSTGKEARVLKNHFPATFLKKVYFKRRLCHVLLNNRLQLSYLVNLHSLVFTVGFLWKLTNCGGKSVSQHLDSFDASFVVNENLGREWADITSTRKSFRKEIILDFGQSTIRPMSSESSGTSAESCVRPHNMNADLNASCQRFLLTTACTTSFKPTDVDRGVQVRYLSALELGRMLAGIGLLPPHVGLEYFKAENMVATSYLSEGLTQLMLLSQSIEEPRQIDYTPHPQASI
uniref:Uncharacterized protein n=1 Tax=Tanacetum cinerariifolium TaxID=118510 RepID=A0A6L2JFV7_TANCI|nr:hypothetical protein [Tanacetum cinerariifolium]